MALRLSRGCAAAAPTACSNGECVALGMLPMIEDKSLVRRTRAIYRTLGLPTRTGVDKN